MTPQHIDLVIYHADCPDGFCAAFIAKKRWPKATLLPAAHGQPVPTFEMIDHHVLVVDFSWKRDALLYAHEAAASLTVLDHHKTAEAELADLPFCHFDISRSGAQLSWDYCFPGEARPWYVDYVADRDLWTWALPDSKEVNAYIMTLGHDVTSWNELDDTSAADCTFYGIGARAQVEHYVDKVCNQAYAGRWSDLSVLIVNAAYPNISDVGNELCLRGAQVGLGWFVRGDGLMQFSLRSIGEIDVSRLAQLHGGGGHKNAAGFQISVADGLSLLSSLRGTSA
jgi:oligoribonuclease NrnB/cAMP/cGMP phosphodiesterase (DHH superfamily)